MSIYGPVNIEKYEKSGDAKEPGGGPADFRALAAHRETFLAAVDSGELYRVRWVKFKIIDGCNIRCVMCNHWRREEYLRTFLTGERLLRLGEELSELGARHVHWSGGEPTLRRELPEIIRRYAELGIDSSLTSNGTRLTKDYAARLCDAGLGAAILSLESADPTVHDRVVGSDGAWQKLLDGAAYLGQHPSHSPRLSFQTVLTRLNTVPSLTGMVPLAARLGVSKIKFQPLYVRHLSAEERSLLPTAAQLQSLRREYLPLMTEMGQYLGVEVKVDGGEDETRDAKDAAPQKNSIARRISEEGEHALGYYSRHTCYLPWYHCTIDYRGDVFACCHMRDEDGYLGNIARRPLLEVLQSERARRLRHRLKSADVPASCLECTMQIEENQKIELVLQSSQARR